MGTPKLRGNKDPKKAKKPRKSISAIPSFAVGSVSFGNPLRAKPLRVPPGR